MRSSLYVGSARSRLEAEGPISTSDLGVSLYAGGDIKWDYKGERCLASMHCNPGEGDCNRVPPGSGRTRAKRENKLLCIPKRELRLNPDNALELSCSLGKKGIELSWSVSQSGNPSKNFFFPLSLSHCSSVCPS